MKVFSATPKYSSTLPQCPGWDFNLKRQPYCLVAREMQILLVIGLEQDNKQITSLLCPLIPSGQGPLDWDIPYPEIYTSAGHH